MSREECTAALAKIAEKIPEAVMHVHMAYYTGMVDTVAHIPDRCVIADGYEVSDYQTEQRKFGLYPSGKEREVSLRYINFEDQTRAGRRVTNRPV